MTRRRRRWIPILAAVLAVAVILAGALIWRAGHTGTVEVYPVSNLYTTYWADTTYLDGYVTTGEVQTVTLREGLVESVNVSAGDTVSAGDVLMVYDTTTFELTLQSDQAQIAVLESSIQTAQNALTTYKGLKPAESMPQPTEEIVDHGELVLCSTIDAGDCTGGDMDFLCGPDTVVTAAFLRALRDCGGTASFEMYDGDTLYGCWTVDGADLPVTRTEYQPVTVTVAADDAGGAADAPTDGETEEDSQTEETDQSEEIGQSGGSETYTAEYYLPVAVEALDEDWYPGQCAAYNGDGATVDLSVGWGSFESCSPIAYERYETIYTDNYVPDGSENYLYTKAELAQMISDQEESIAGLQLDLKAAQLTYQQDQLIGETGEITAAISGTVTEVNDTASLSVGDTLLTVKGSESYCVTAYIGELDLASVEVGDTLSVYAYESGSSVSATITEIGTAPASGSYGWGTENPNNSYYPVTAVVDDPDADMVIGEWCEITLDLDEEDGEGLYLESMFVRSDDGGDYVMLADDTNRLVKRYVSTGKSLWGSYIEIKSGLTLDDRVAFPYGSSVKEGAAVVDADYPNYY